MIRLGLLALVRLYQLVWALVLGRARPVIIRGRSGMEALADAWDAHERTRAS